MVRDDMHSSLADFFSLSSLFINISYFGYDWSGGMWEFWFFSFRNVIWLAYYTFAISFRLFDYFHVFSYFYSW